MAPINTDNLVDGAIKLFRRLVITVVVLGVAVVALSIHACTR